MHCKKTFESIEVNFLDNIIDIFWKLKRRYKLWVFYKSIDFARKANQNGAGKNEAVPVRGRISDFLERGVDFEKFFKVDQIDFLTSPKSLERPQFDQIWPRKLFLIVLVKNGYLEI